MTSLCKQVALNKPMLAESMDECVLVNAPLN
jgi:hypothetical protein